MKKIVEREEDWCDHCKQRRVYFPSMCCIGCGKVFCGECRDQYVIYDTGHRTVPTSPTVCILTDGLYCKECDRALVDDPLHRAYVDFGRAMARLGGLLDKRRAAAHRDAAETTG